MTQEPEQGRIVFSGGNVPIGALAQGPGARASQVVSQPAADPDSAAGVRNSPISCATCSTPSATTRAI